MALRKFIGGHQDGRLVEVSEDKHQVEMLWTEAVAVVNGPDWHKDFSPHAKIYRELYHERLIRGGGHTFYVFVLDGMTDAEMMDKLIMGYRSE